jgi:hypothetical protein
MHAALFLLTLSTPAAGVVAAAPQAADVNHCVRDDGILVYTDKPCASVRAHDIGEDDAARGPFMPAYRNACIGSLREFAYELSSAIEVGDVNRLAALYRWNGTSTRAGYATMARLQEIVSRPLLQVEPVYPAPAPEPATPPFVVLPPAAAPAAPAPAAPAIPPPPPAAPAAAPTAAPTAEPFASSGALRHGPPVALRLDQTLANGVTPAPTTLRLQRELGCWWVSL